MSLTQAQRVQLAIRYPGVPVLRFGSQELTDFHADKWHDYPLQRYYHTLHHPNIPGYGRDTRNDVVRVSKVNAQYIVDHGGFLTLNTLTYGRCAPRMDDIELY